MNPFDQQKSIVGIKKIIAVGSGKGGVGKSTVSSNLAASLSEAGHKVGLLDADVYGPSVPSLFGCLDQSLEMHENKMVPQVRYGIKLMSMGFLVEEDQPIIWRGPMLFKAIDQFLNDVVWGELDYLIVDLPPGTGDVVLTLAQKVPVDKALVVSTSQTLSLSEVKKAIMMFKKVDIPVSHLVLNMTAYTTESGEVVSLFPEADFSKIQNEYGIDQLLKIPYNKKIGTSAEAGVPFIKATQENSESKRAFKSLCESL